MVHDIAPRVRPTKVILSAPDQCPKVLELFTSVLLVRSCMLPFMHPYLHPKLIEYTIATPNHDSGDLIAVSGRIVLGTDDQTSSLLGSFIDSLDNVDQLLLVFQYPVQLVVVTGPKITHLHRVSRFPRRARTHLTTICLLRKKNIRVTGS